AQLTTGRAGEFQCRVEHRGEAEPDAELGDAAGHGVRFEHGGDPERLQHIGRAALRRRRPVAVLDHRRPRGRGDDRAHRGDVHRAGAIATGADDVHRRSGDVEPPSVGQHAVGHAHDLVRCLALGAQPHGQRGDLRRRRLAGHHLVHRPRRLARAQVLAGHQAIEQIRPGVRAHRARPLLRPDGGDPVRTQDVGDGVGCGDRVQRMHDHGVRLRPGGQPPVVLASHRDDDRGAVGELVLQLPAQAHAAVRLRLAVQDRQVDAACVTFGDHVGDLVHFHVGDPAKIARRTTPDGGDDRLAYLGLVAVHQDSPHLAGHATDCSPSGEPANTQLPGGARSGPKGHNAGVTTAAPTISQRVHSLNRPNMVSVGTIVWLSSELMFFAGLFAMFFTVKAQNTAENWPPNPPGWTEAEPFVLNLPWALPFTIILVASSFTCQLGVFAAEKGDVFGLRRWYLLTLFMGAVFLFGQVYEYFQLVDEGVTLQANGFGTVFYLTTGFHGLHVLGGLIAFVFLLIRTKMSKFTPAQATSAIVVSYYWHFVDIVWIGLFAVIYIVP